MALQLTTAIDVGVLDVHDYTHVKIQNCNLDAKNKSIQFNTSEGYMSSGVFQRGMQSRDKNFEIYNRPAKGIEGQEGYVAADPQYDNLVGDIYGEANVLLYDSVASTLYQWLIDNGHYIGAIV
jgi:hypothetical protein